MSPEFESAIPENPGAPDARRFIAEAVDSAAEALDPDQIILFGSAARGEMTERSDIDLLVVRESGPFGHFPGFGGRRVDVVVTDRASAEERRLLAADVRQYALEDGCTLYITNGFEPLRTGDPRFLSGVPVPADPVYNFDKAPTFLDQADRQWRVASRLRGDDDDALAEAACAALQRCLELSLKALHLSFGKPVKATHDLAELCRAVDDLSGSGRLFDLDPAVLKGLTPFVGRDFYDRPPSGRPDPFRLLDAAAGPVEGVLTYARNVVPGRVERLRARFGSAGAPPSADAAGGGPPCAAPAPGRDGGRPADDGRGPGPGRG